MAANPFRRKRDGSQWVFDFMRDPACHFPPGCLFLGLEQVGQIFEDQNIAQPLASMLQRSHGDGRIEAGTMQSYFQLRGGCAHAVGAPQQWLQVFQNLLGKYFLQGSADHDQVRGLRS